MTYEVYFKVNVEDADSPEDAAIKAEADVRDNPYECMTEVIDTNRPYRVGDVVFWNGRRNEEDRHAPRYLQREGYGDPITDGMGRWRDFAGNEWYDDDIAWDGLRWVAQA